MNVVLTESQYIKLLKEEREGDIADIFSNSKSFTKKLIKDVKKQHGIDFTFALTWGSVIGGFIGPISKYLEGRYPNLTESDITLICFGIMLTFFSDNKEKLKKVLELIKERNIRTFFNQALLKTYDLKNAFFNFIESLNVSFPKISNMIAYTFLVPLVPLIKNIAELDLSKNQIEMLIMGITHYTGTVVSSHIVHNLIEKMIKRFKS